jgi:hypothetical protein
MDSAPYGFALALGAMLSASACVNHEGAVFEKKICSRAPVSYQMAARQTATDDQIHAILSTAPLPGEEGLL